MRLEHWFYTVPLRLRSLFRRGRVEQELDEEFQCHVERRIQEFIAKGVTPDEARYAALRAMGGLEKRKEECRNMRHVQLIENLIQDVRYGLLYSRNASGARRSDGGLALRVRKFGVRRAWERTHLAC